MTTCPTRDELEQFLSGSSSADRRQAIASHVSGCAACRETLPGMEAQVQVRAWQKMLGVAGSAPDGENLKQFLQAAKAAIADEGPRLQEHAPPAEQRLRHVQQELQPFRLLVELGEGSYGAVYKALDEVDRPVAIKVLKAQMAVRAEDRARFLREARAAAAVKHDHVVMIHHVHVPEAGAGTPYIVMEHVAGETLQERLERERTLPPPEAARIVCQAARGLAAAHAQGLVHRDVKPSNILLEAASARAKISDFGLARPLDAEQERLTQPGGIVGTPGYMSPEQIISPQAVDARSDIYSLGVVLYEALTGERPFRGVTGRTLFLQIVHDEPRQPRTINDTVPRDLETITLKCLAKEPNRRYASAADLADDLDRFQTGVPIRARPVGSVERLWRWCRRNPLPAGLAAAVVLFVLTTTTMLFSWQVARADLAEAETVQSRETARHQLTEANLRSEEEKRQRAEALVQALPLVEVANKLQADNFHGGRALYLAEALPSLESKLQVSHHAAWMEAIQLALVPVQTQFVPPGPKPAAIPRTWGLISAADYHPGKNLIVTAGRAQGAYLRAWKAEDLKEYRDYLGPEPDTEPITTLESSPSGDHFVTAHAGGNLWLWDTESGVRKRLIEGAHTTVARLAWSRDGKRLATCGDGQVKIWDAHSGKLQSTLSGQTVHFAADNKHVITAGGEPAIRLWQIDPPQVVHRFVEHGESPKTVTVSSDGKYLASGSAHGLVTLWDLQKRTFLQTIHLRPLAGTERFIRALDLEDKERDRTEFTWQITAREISSLAFSPDASWLAIVLGDGSLALVNRTTGLAHFRGMGHDPDELGQRLLAAFFTKDSELLTVGSDGTLRRWDLPAWRVGRTILHASRWAEKLIAAPDGRGWLALVSPGKLVRWTGEPEQEEFLWMNKADAPAALAGLADKVAIATYRGNGAILDLESKRLVAEFHKPAGDKGAAVKKSIAVESAMGLAATAAAAGQVYIWRIADGQLVHTLPGAGQEVFGLAFRPHGNQLAVSYEDGAAKLWRVSPDEAEPTHTLSGAVQSSLCYSPDGRHLVQAGLNSVIAVWDADSGQRLHSLRGHRPMGLDKGVPHVLVWAAAYSPNGRWLATAGAEGVLRLWDVAADYRPVAALHTAEVRSLCGGRPGPLGNALPPALRTALRGVAFSADSRQLVAAGYQGVARLYDLPAVLSELDRTPRQLLAITEQLTGLRRRGEALTPLSRTP